MNQGHKYLKEHLLDHMILCVALSATVKLLSNVAAPFWIFFSNSWEFLFLHILGRNLVIFSILVVSHSNSCVMTSHCFNLWFANDIGCEASPHRLICLPSSQLHWLDVSSDFCLFLIRIFFFFLLIFKNYLHILDTTHSHFHMSFRINLSYLQKLSEILFGIILAP